VNDIRIKIYKKLTYGVTQVRMAEPGNGRHQEGRKELARN
jgi:hypothetical protein